MVRLQKYLSECGIAARRKAEELISAGRVKVNGRVVKVLGCVYSDPKFTDQHLVINGASDLFHQVFGKDTDGYHARSALGFAALPTGAAVEVEAVLEIKGA